MIKDIENGIRVWTADPGMKLTNDSSYVSVIRLGIEADGSEWYEITEEEAERRQAEDMPSDEPMDELQQKAAAYDILMGVNE